MRILNLNIYESELWAFERPHKFCIHYGESGAILTKIDDSSDSGDDHSDSEHENSESIDESIDDYDYTNENGENSNFMDEYLD